MNRAGEKGMTLIVKTVTKLTAGFIFLYGLYITLSSHNSPGGGFAGGVIMALLFILITLAFGKDVSLRKLRAGTLRIVIAAAALIFLCGVMVGRPEWMFGNGFVLPLCEMAVVGAGLSAVFIALVSVSKSGKDPE